MSNTNMTIKWIKLLFIFVLLFIISTYTVLSLPPFNKIVYPEPILIIALAISVLTSLFFTYVFYNKFKVND